MNTFDLSKKGGHPFKKTDLKFTWDTFLEAINAISSTFNAVQDPEFEIPFSCYILSGCFVSETLTDYNITTGYIYLFGELFKVPAASLPKEIDKTPYFQINESYSGEFGPAAYATGSTYNLHKSRTISLVMQTTDVEGSFSVQGAKRFAKANKVQPAWINVEALGASWTNFSGSVKYRKNEFGKVELDSAVLKRGLLGADVIFTLPEDYRPSFKRRFICPGADSGNPDIIVTVDVNGDVKYDGYSVSGAGIGVNVYYDLNTISFEAV